jgi:hypothetical protein
MLLSRVWIKVVTCLFRARSRCRRCRLRPGLAGSAVRVAALERAAGGSATLPSFMISLSPGRLAASVVTVMKYAPEPMNDPDRPTPVCGMP